jgi:hypothetical protein
MPSPILLNFYSPEDEILKTYSRNGIPAGVMKKAMKYQREIIGKSKDDLQTDENLLDSLAALIVELYGDRFTMDELYKHSYFEEWFPLITQMFTRSGAIQKQYSPTFPLPTKNKKRRS